MFGGHSYDALKDSLAPVGARRHIPANYMLKNTLSKKGLMKALRALHILQRNEHQSVALAVFHDEACDFDEGIANLHKQCVEALEFGGCPVDSMPMFSDWLLTMTDKEKEAFKYDMGEYIRKSIAKLERERAEAVEFLQGKLRQHN